MKIHDLFFNVSLSPLDRQAFFQFNLNMFKYAGVELFACRACADNYGVSDKLSNLGIDVKYMGVPLTEILKKGDWKTLTF